ncbi:MAG: hypothetical protein AAF572_28045 [Cyanobacteria bacterium P01_B01_bin.77]
MQNGPLFFNLMQADTQASSTPEINLTPLVGTWVNVNTDSQYLTKLIFTTGNRKLLLHSYSANESDSNDLGEIEVTPYVSSASRNINGFHGTYSFEAAEICFSGRFISGIVEVMVNTRYLDNSGRTNHFSREFFRQLKPDVPPPNFIDFSDALGTWINAKPTSQGIQKFVLKQSEQGLRLHPYGVTAPEDWGEVEVTPFISPTGERAFLADYQFDGHQIHIAANTNKGLWVLATHYVYEQPATESESSQPNFLRREFFCYIDTPNH